MFLSNQKNIREVLFRLDPVTRGHLSLLNIYVMNRLIGILLIQILEKEVDYDYVWGVKKQ